MRIKDEDITFVVSGFVSTKKTEPFTAELALSSVRCWFPKSPIVLTTWQGEDVTSVKELYDELVLCDATKVKYPDIRSSLKKSNLKRQSINQQIYSVNQGLQRVKTKYAVRLRTDFYLTGRQFIKTYYRLAKLFPARNPDYALYEEKVLIPKMYTRDPARVKGYYAFESSDFFAFGLTRDLLQRWNGKQKSIADLDYFSRLHFNEPQANPYQANSRFSIEQYHLLQLLKQKKPKIRLPQSYCDTSSADFTLNTHRVMVSNFYIASFRELGLQSRFLAKERKSKKWFEIHRYIYAYMQQFNITPALAVRYLCTATIWIWRHYFGWFLVLAAMGVGIICKNVSL